MADKKLIYVENNVYANQTTGEVIKGTLKKVVKIPQEPNYVKLYLDAILYISDIPEGITGVMLEILKRMPFADKKQKIALTKSIKEDIAEALNVSESYVRKSISQLTKGKLLLHTGSARSCCYIINPHIFGRGEWKDIEELQLHVIFNAKGKSFWTEVQKSKKNIIDSMNEEMTKQKLAELEKGESLTTVLP